MAIPRKYQVDVGTTPTAIDGTQYPWWVLMNNGGTTVYLGGSNVDTATGFPVAAGEVYRPEPRSYESLRGKQEDRLWGVVASGTEDVRVLLEGRVNP